MASSPNSVGREGRWGRWGSVILCIKHELPKVFVTILKFLPFSIDTTKPLLIYIPGMDGSGRLLQNQKGIWQNFDVRCLNIPSQEIEWEQLTEDLVFLIKEELFRQGKRRVYVCGESFGACLALKLAESIPHLIHQIILINSASAFNKRPLLNLGTYATRFMSDYVYRSCAGLLLPFLTRSSNVSPSQQDKLLAAMEEVPPNIVSWRLTLLDKFTYPSKQLKLPVLIVASAKDQLLPSVAEARKLKQFFFHGQIRILPDSGHCCLLESKVDLSQIIQQQEAKINSRYSRI